MLLIDLFEELFQTGREQKTFKGALKNSRNGSTNNQIGQGTQARAKADRHDPHMVTKYNKNPYAKEEVDGEPRYQRRDDGFHRFISYMIEHKLMGENPHFPRVYNIKTITDAKGQHIHSYTVEKLLDFDAIPKPQLEAFIEHSLHPEIIYSGDLNPASSDWVGDVFMRIAVNLRECVTYESVAKQSIKSESLMEAISMLRDMQPTLGLVDDLHEGNFMWRQSSTGMTLVINDPYY